MCIGQFNGFWINQIIGLLGSGSVSNLGLLPCLSVHATLKYGQKTEKNPAAVALGHLGGLKGGKARAEKLSPKKRREIAQKAAQTRWSNRT
jgi:hypothetical protein